MQVRFQIARDDDVYVETQQQAPAYDAVTKAYLCAQDDSFTELFSVRNTPPTTGTVCLNLPYT
ncbi:MAG: hypothetical protein J6M64_12925 [Oscillospiraceae bacterium]|nr:hypothetical protein [Oscillospiraceae bacterium]